jgi:tRNA (guanine10-N2)-methyltransferase
MAEAEGDGVWVLAVLAQAHSSVWDAELEARVETSGADARMKRLECDNELAGPTSDGAPLRWLHFRTLCCAINVLQQCACVKSALDVWALAPRNDFGTLSSDFHARAGAAYARSAVGPSTRFKYETHVIGSSHSPQQKLSVIDRFDSVLQLPGIVDLSSPEERIWLVELPPNDIQSHNSAGLMLAGRELCRRQVKALPTLHLSRRLYTGPTTMASEMSLLMCSVAGVQPGSLVLDPLCGSCGILLAASYLGASPFGFDVDIRVLRGERSDLDCTTAPSVNVFSNFEQLRLEQPYCIARMDLHRPSLRNSIIDGLFDAVIADPPYGLRAGGRKSGKKKVQNRKENMKTKHLECASDDGGAAQHRSFEHLPRTKPYSLSECINDLLCLATRALNENGRLVYFLPGQPEVNAHELVPVSEHFTVRRVCEERLSLYKSRYLVIAQRRSHANSTEDCDSLESIGNKLEIMIGETKFDMRKTEISTLRHSEA